MSVPLKLNCRKATNPLKYSNVLVTDLADHDVSALLYLAIEDPFGNSVTHEKRTRNDFCVVNTLNISQDIDPWPTIYNVTR